jgi:hypothetical protein
MAWLGALGAALGVALLGAGATAAAIIPLIAIYLVAAGLTLFEFQPRQLKQAVPVSPLSRMRMSPQAREAVERARRRGAIPPTGITITDVGLIALQTSADGSMVMRRGRSVSLDDRGVRPYVSLNIDAQAADRNAIVRYEILDQNGTVQYVHELKTFLRDGEMNILADTQLPLTGNDRLTGAGEWDLRVSVDGMTAALLSFTATPSIANRTRLYAQREEQATTRLQDEMDDSSPVSLQDLLRSSGDERRSQR